MMLELLGSIVIAPTDCASNAVPSQSGVHVVDTLQQLVVFQIPPTVNPAYAVVALANAIALARPLTVPYLKAVSEVVPVESSGRGPMVVHVVPGVMTASRFLLENVERFSGGTSGIFCWMYWVAAPRQSPFGSFPVGYVSRSHSPLLSSSI